MDPRLDELSARFVAGRDALVAFVHGLLRDRDRAEDIVQETWLRLAAASAGGAAIDDLSGWCRGVARNLVLHHWRDQRRSRLVMDSALLDLVERSFAEDAAPPDEHRARDEALRACLETLPPGQREVLALRYAQAEAIDAIAGRLRRSAASVLMILSRARRSLAACAERRLRRAALAEGA